MRKKNRDRQGEREGMKRGRGDGRPKVKRHHI